MRRFTTAGVVAILVALVGCVSVIIVPSYWRVRTEGNPTVALQAIAVAAQASGGKPLAESTATNVSYAFNDATISFWVNQDAVAVLANVATSGLTGRERKVDALLEQIVRRAAQDAHLPLRLEAATYAETHEELMSRTGATVAVKDSKLQAYGLYLQRVASHVQLEFDRRVGESRKFPPVGSWVTITFVLLPDGRVGQITKVEGRTSELGRKLALEALTASGSFGAWTADMKSTLNPAGEELVFQFRYE